VLVLPICLKVTPERLIAPMAAFFGIDFCPLELSDIDLSW
jgi:hypothetical protein